jgi:tetratricopeptide (TPR) repeat protein
MIQEYLKADAGCVPLLELLGLVHEQNGNRSAAATSYGQAAQVLLKTPDPDAPYRPGELFAKMKALDPSNPLINDLSRALTEPASVSEAVAPTPPAAIIDEVVPSPIAGEAATLKLAWSPPSPAPADAVPTEAPSGTESSTQEQVSAPPPLVLAIDAAPAAAAPGQPYDAAPASVAPTAPAPTEQDHRIQYELGMAYKNMGMLQEAIEEFRLAMHGKECFLDAASMLSACLKEQGLAEPAMESLELVLADPRCDKDRATAIRYELGLLYEADGLIDKAMEVFSTIPGFLDVPVRLERLRDPKPERAEMDVGGGEATMAAANAAPSERKKRRISYL